MSCISSPNSESNEPGIRDTGPEAPLNGTTCVLSQQSNSNSKFDPKTLCQFQTAGPKNFTLSHTDVEELPDGFAAYLQNVTTLNLTKNKLIKLPTDIGKLRDLETIDLSHNELPSLPEDIKLNVNLRTVIAAHNKIVEFPLPVCSLTHLVHLDLSSNSIVKVPEEICSFTHLKYLNLSKNSLQVLPDSIGELKQLTNLNLSGNSISVLPKTFTLFMLTVLNMSHNCFVEVPDCMIVSLPNLITIDFSHNKIQFFDSAPKCIGKLVFLNLSYNAFSDIPQWIFGSRCKALSELDISNNRNMIGTSQISAYAKRGEKVGVTTTLRTLIASNCCFTSNSLKFLHGLEALEKLVLGNEIDNRVGNVFFNFPTDTLNTCKNLKHIDLKSVTLSDIPDNIGSFSDKLLSMDVSYNNLYWLPPTICYLSTLVSLRISHNQVSYLPSEFGLLTSLQHLSLDGNKLQSLPESFGSLTNLIFLDLYDNLLTELPEVVTRFERLEALDLGYNCFPDDDLPEQDDGEFLARYKELKGNLRKQHADDSRGKTRFDSVKLEPAPEEYESCEGAYESYSDDDIEEEKRDSQSDEYVPKCEEEENWDVTEDSDNEFDPNYVVRMPIQPLRNPTLLICDSVVNNADNFCPSDIHCVPIRRGRNYLHQTPIEPIEGQFDDDDQDT